MNVVPSPRNSSGGGGGSRRGSKDSFDDDPEIRAYISAMCDISGKNTRSTQQHFRRLRAQQKGNIIKVYLADLLQVTVSKLLMVKQFAMIIL